MIHRLDPRAKVVAAACFALMVALSNQLSVALSALCLALVVTSLSRLWTGALARRLLLANTFILFLWLFLPFTTPGHPLLTAGSLSVTREGLLLSCLIAVKANAVILTMISLVATIPAITLGQALLRLRLPSKLCHLLLFVVRYIQVIEEEYARLRRAMRVRAFAPGTNLHTYRSYAHLLGMLFVRSWDRAERIHKAMRCRGFQGRLYSLKDFNLSSADMAFIALSLLVILGLAGLEILQRSLHA